MMKLISTGNVNNKDVLRKNKKTKASVRKLKCTVELISKIEKGNEVTETGFNR